MQLKFHHSISHRNPQSVPTILWSYISNKGTLFFRETQTHGYRFLLLNRSWPERLFWALVLLSISILTIWFIQVECKTFLQAPTITVEMPVWLSTSDIAFPAVAICTTNLISKKALRNLAEKV